MIKGHFYFLEDTYYVDFPDDDIQKNHEIIDGQIHDKPCFCAIEESETGIFWLVPISSKTDKYHDIANRKIQKYHKCDTILFGNVLGHEKAFLIQNMVPVTRRYIKNEYLDSFGNPVRVDGVFEMRLIKAVNDVLNKQRRGINLIFPDVLSIEKELLK